MNMQNTNCCEGCFYAGAINGYKPECNCRKIAEVKAAQAEKVENPNSDDLWDQYTEEDEVSGFVATKDRSKSVRRRINRVKANKKAVGILPIVKAKLKKVHSNDNGVEYYIANSKCDSVIRTAKRRHQTVIAISFPELSKKHYGKTLMQLIDTFSRWLATANFDGKYSMALACENAISALKTVKSCDGEVVSLHREGNVLHVRVGFLDKISMLNFKEKTSSNN